MAGITLDDYLDKPDFYRDPYPVYHQLRAADPVHWSEIMGSWVLTRYDDVVATMRDPRPLLQRRPPRTVAGPSA